MSTPAEPFVACSVAWCIQPSIPGMVLFDLPVDDNEKQRWMTQLSISEPVASKFFVCSSHFADDAFVPGSSFLTLKPNVLPSRNYFLRPLVPLSTTIKTEPIVDRSSTETICRCCMIECKDDHKLLSVPENLSLFETLTGVELTKSERLPNTICSGCFETITNWQIFKNQCKSSNETFAKRLAEEDASNLLIDFSSIKRKINTLMSSNKRKKIAPVAVDESSVEKKCKRDKQNAGETKLPAVMKEDNLSDQPKTTPILFNKQCQPELNENVIGLLDHIKNEQLSLGREMGSKLEETNTKCDELRNFLANVLTDREDHLLDKLETIYGQLGSICKELSITQPNRPQRCLQSKTQTKCRKIPESKNVSKK